MWHKNSIPSGPYYLSKYGFSEFKVRFQNKLVYFVKELFLFIRDLF